ncbi:hypothetical protein RFI_37688, partial [Reticulomyxa filosa]
FLRKLIFCLLKKFFFAKFKFFSKFVHCECMIIFAAVWFFFTYCCEFVKKNCDGNMYFFDEHYDSSVDFIKLLSKSRQKDEEKKNPQDSKDNINNELFEEYKAKYEKAKKQLAKQQEQHRLELVQIQQKHDKQIAELQEKLDKCTPVNPTK